MKQSPNDVSDADRGGTAAPRVGPLAGVTVIEHASVLLGPMIGQILGDLGADVIKVESDVVDAGRLIGVGPHPELSGVALNALRNKRSIRLNLKEPAGRAILLRLMADSDIFITNARPRSLTAMGIDYDSIRADCPHLVYLEAHGYRSDSDEANRPAFDDVIQAEAGLPMLQSALGLGVQYFPMVIADMVSALTGAYAVLAGLVDRNATGTGQRIEVPMLDSVLAFMLTEHLSAATVPGGEPGHQRVLTSLRRPHQTIDGYVAVLPYSDRDWHALFTAAGMQDKLADPRFADRGSRNENAEFVYGSLAELVAKFTTDDFLKLCGDLDIPSAPVPTLAEIIRNPRLNRGLLEPAIHPMTGPYLQIKPPAIFDRSGTTLRRPAPLIGEHSAEILHGLGFAPSEVERLLAEGAAWQRPVGEAGTGPSADR